MKTEQMYICPKADECLENYKQGNNPVKHCACREPHKLAEDCLSRKGRDSCPKCIPITEKECGDCKGMGEFVDIDSRSYTICPTCNGSGKSPKTDSVDELDEIICEICGYSWNFQQDCPVEHTTKCAYHKQAKQRILELMRWKG